MCFGLEQDRFIKKGQIAHLDQDSSNDSLENLVYLCFDHHDEFDSKTSQAKGLTKGEILQYKKMLLLSVGKFRANAVKDGSPLAGKWESWEGYRSISIADVGAQIYRIEGVAIDNPEKEAPNIGSFDIVCAGGVDQIRVQDQTGVRIDIRAQGPYKISVEDHSVSGTFGNSVHFEGEYELSGSVTEFFGEML